MLFMMMHGDTGYYTENQDALIIAQVVPNDNDNIKMRVIKAIYQKASLTLESEIYLEPLSLYFNLPEEKPKVGEYAVVPLKRLHESENLYMLSYNYMCRSDIGDYSALRLYYDCNNPAAMDILAIEKYVNSDGKSRNFTFDGEQNLLTVKDSSDNIIEKIRLDRTNSYMPKIPAVLDIVDNALLAPAVYTQVSEEIESSQAPHDNPYEEVDIADIIPEPDNRVDKIVPVPLIVLAAIVFLASMSMYFANRKKSR